MQFVRAATVAAAAALFSLAACGPTSQSDLDCGALEACGDRCVDLQGDPDHCGACGN